MEENIWISCHGDDHINTLNKIAWRMVEAQDNFVTRKLVDSLYEQNILEDLIESTKPALSVESLSFHQLFYTPFRYPPLKHGSRFGTRFQPSLWYGSLEINATMAEVAYYRFNFLRASKATFENVQTQHTLFSANVRTSQGVDLTLHPFSEFSVHISSPLSYQVSQKLGVAMRQANVEAFCYQSARDPGKGTNVGLFTPKAIATKEPNVNSFQTWQCLANDNIVEFSRLSAIHAEPVIFPIETFLVNDELPFPASV